MIETHKLLKKHFAKKKKSSKGFSLRSLAKQLDISPSFLSRVLSGEKAIPYALLVRLAPALDIDSETVSGLKEAHSTAIEGGVIPKRGKAVIQNELEDWELIEKTDFNILRNWFYIPILELTNLQNFDGSAEMIASRLGLSKTTAEIAVRELTDKGFLKEVGGKIRKTRRKIRWGSAISLPDIRNFHSQMLDKAKAELQNATAADEFSKRMIMGISVTTSAAEIEKAKKKLSDCLHEIANDLMQSAGDEVYHLAGQFFPLTKNRNK